MSTYALPHALPARRPTAAVTNLRILPALLTFGAVMFNAGLAFINAMVTPLTPAVVVGAELMLVAAAHCITLANFRPQMLPWYILMAALLLFACWRGIMMEQFEPKYLRDALLIPTFIVLGMTFDTRGLTRLVVAVHAVMLVVLVVEAVDQTTYSTLFKVQDYYINTRGYVADDFWNKQSDLFVSAVRPDTRMFSFITLHRLSSVFLEPVSMGNYCIVITAFICARYRQLSVATRLFLIVGTLLALLGCDGRLAALASVLIIVVSVLAPRLPPYISVLYLPGVTAAVFLVVFLADLHAGSDDFSGRLAHTVELISRFELAELFGISEDRTLIQQAVDSGLAYLILSQSLIGVILLWLFITLGSAERTPSQIRYKHAVCIYLSLTMMVSFAFLSIKTGALLWFVHGALQKAQVGGGMRRSLGSPP